MSIFTIKNNRLVIDPVLLMIPEWKHIWDRDKTKDKQVAEQELLYVYFKSDKSKRNPYNNYPQDLVDQKIIKDFIKDEFWQPDSIVKLAVEKYLEMQVTPATRFLESARGAAEKLQSYFDGVDWAERDDKGGAVYKVNDVTKALSSVGNIISSIEKLEEKVQREQSTSKIKGGGETNKFEL